MDKPGMTTAEAALFWLDQGVAPIPLVYQSKVPAVKWVEFRDRLPSEKLIEQWFGWQARNIALVTGWQNLAVLDFDSPEAYAIFFVWAFEHRPEILNTYRVQSNRGIHLYYYLREPVKLGSIQNALFEIKTGGKLVTTVPSVHESNRVYTALDDPANIRVVRPEEILNYSPVVFAPQKPKEIYTSQFAPAAHTGQVSCIGEIKARIKILSFFPHAKQVDHEGRYWRTNCPFHGRKDNFWIDNVLGMCGCYAGCGTFDIIDLWEKWNNMTTREAIQDLEKLL